MQEIWEILRISLIWLILSSMAGTEISVSMNIHIHIYIYVVFIILYIHLYLGRERDKCQGEIIYGTYPACAKSNTKDWRPGSEFINSAGDCTGMKRWTAAFTSPGVWNTSMVYPNYPCELTKKLIGFKLLAVLALKSENETVRKEDS